MPISVMCDGEDLERDLGEAAQWTHIGESLEGFSLQQITWCLVDLCLVQEMGRLA